MRVALFSKTKMRRRMVWTVATAARMSSAIVSSTPAWAKAYGRDSAPPAGDPLRHGAAAEVGGEDRCHPPEAENPKVGVAAGDGVQGAARPAPMTALHRLNVAPAMEPEGSAVSISTAPSPMRCSAWMVASSCLRWPIESTPGQATALGQDEKVSCPPQP